MTDLPLDRHSPIPLAEQLEHHLQHLIQTGRLRAGQRLPAVRELAEQISLNYNTVAAVYRALERRGFVTLRRGDGSRVAHDPPAMSPTDLALNRVVEGALEQVSKSNLSPCAFARLATLHATKPPPVAPLRVLVSSIDESHTKELVTQFNALLSMHPHVRLETTPLHDADLAQPYDLVITDLETLQRAQQAPTLPELPFRSYYEGTFRDALGAD